MMRILLMMPQWEDACKGWMQRILLSVSQDLAAIAVNNSRENRLWRGNIPVYSLKPPARQIRYISRLFEMCRFSLLKMASKPEDALKSVIQQSSVTHIYCQYGTYAANFMEVWRKTDIPLFIHFHGYDATFDLRQSDQPDKRIFSSEYMGNIKELSQRAIFIANSNYTRSLLVTAGIRSDRMVVKYLGVPLSDKKRIHEKKVDIQILHIGRLVDFKSPDRTIKAFEIARSKGLNGRLVIAGDGPLRTSCELLRLRSLYSDSIQLLGEVSSQYAQNLLSESDIFTQHNIGGEISRQSECFGVSIVEAMAYGLPVVGTQHGGVLETVIDGETGILNAPGDVEAQADAFLQLATNPDMRQQMGEAGRARVSAFFSPQQESDLLRRIIGLP